MKEKRPIKLTKFANDLGVTRQTLYRWRKEGRIEFVKIGKFLNGVTRETYDEFMGIKEDELDVPSGSDEIVLHGQRLSNPQDRERIWFWS
jgi:excisionase family DNA binding protein